MAKAEQPELMLELGSAFVAHLLQPLLSKWNDFAQVTNWPVAIEQPEGFVALALLRVVLADARAMAAAQAATLNVDVSFMLI